MNTYNPRRHILLLVTFLAFAIAAFDHIVRTSTESWSEVPIAQWTVFFSPLIYLVLFTLLFFKLRQSVVTLSKRRNNIATVLIFLYAMLLLVQIFLRKQGVGSASYSIVSPLFVSGVPISVLTFLLFFRKYRGVLSSCLICLATVFWLIMPIGIDALYITQGGYRGPVPFQFAVISTSYDLIKRIAALSMFLAFITAPTALIIGFYRAVKAKGIERTYALAVGFSIFTLSIQS